MLIDLASGSLDVGDGASGSISSTAQLLGLTALLDTIVDVADTLGANCTAVGNGGLVAEALVDTSNDSRALDSDVGEGADTSCASSAVSAAAIDLAAVLRIEVLDVDGSATVVLEDLV